PVMKMCLMVSMEVSVPAQRKIEQRIEKMAEDFGGVDFDAMIDAVFATVPVDGVPSSAEEAALRKGRGELRGPRTRGWPGRWRRRRGIPCFCRGGGRRGHPASTSR